MTSPIDYMPALLVFLEDLHGPDGAVTGWRPVAWGIVTRPNGACVTLSAENPPAARLWPDLTAAEDGLGALTAREHPAPGGTSLR